MIVIRTQGKEHITIIYDFNRCDAFYTSHKEDDHPCLIGCPRCGMSEQDPNAQHSFDDGVCLYPNGFTSEGTFTQACQNEGCALNTSPSVETLSPLFTCLGYSASETNRAGIVIGFAVDHAAIEKYTEKTGNTVRYGMFAVSKAKLGENDVLTSEGEANDGVIKADTTSNAFRAISLKVYGFETEAHKESLLAIGAYVITTDDEDTEVSYLQSGTPAEGEEYCFTSYYDIVGKPSTEE